MFVLSIILTFVDQLIIQYMKSRLIVVLFVLFLMSCVSTRDAMNTWLGHTQKEVILKWGPPARTTSDGGTGTILVYAFQGSVYGTGKAYYDYKMLYVNEKNIVYYWMTKRDYVPPTQIDITNFRR
jgi:hypothetical protein